MIAMDHRMKDVFAEEPGARVQVEPRDEDTVSIKDGGDLNIKLNIISQNAEARDDNYCEESSLNVTMAALDMNAATIGACEEKEEMMNENSEKGLAVD